MSFKKKQKNKNIYPFIFTLIFSLIGLYILTIIGSIKLEEDMSNLKMYYIEYRKPEVDFFKRLKNIKPEVTSNQKIYYNKSKELIKGKIKYNEFINFMKDNNINFTDEESEILNYASIVLHKRYINKKNQFINEKKNFLYNLDNHYKYKYFVDKKDKENLLIGYGGSEDKFKIEEP